MKQIVLPPVNDLLHDLHKDLPSMSADKSIKVSDAEFSKSLQALKKNAAHERVNEALQETLAMPLEQYFCLLRVYSILSNRALLPQYTGRKPSLKVALFETPLGNIVSIFGPQGLCVLEFLDQASLAKKLTAVQKTYTSPFVWKINQEQKQLQQELRVYFAGELQRFTVPIDLLGTDFQKGVWQGLTQIAYGQTISYKRESELLGNPRAIRAVAAANGQNKIAIVVPCHRVIGNTGKLVGYGGGLNRKKYLLDLENNMVQLKS